MKKIVPYIILAMAAAVTSCGNGGTVPDCGSQVEQALSLAGENRAELEKVRQGEGPCLEWYGLIAVVEQCRKEGKTPQETAACLKERGASLAMIGGLMHPQGDIKDWQQYGKDLFNGSTKTLPW